MIIVGVLSTTAIIRFSSSDTELQSAKSDVLAALVFAREMAMARSGGNNTIQVVLSATSIDVKSNNVSQSSSSQNYPLIFSSGIQISSGTGTMNFNAIGETNARSVVLTQSSRSVNITVSGTGYVY